MKKIFVFLALTLFTLVVMGGDIKIGVAFPMTGGIAAFGQQTYEGVLLAQQFFPTVLGRKIDLILADNRSDKTEAANVVSRLIFLNDVVAIIGELASSNTMAGGAIAEKAHVPMLSPTSTACHAGEKVHIESMLY